MSRMERATKALALSRQMRRRESQWYIAKLVKAAAGPSRHHISSAKKVGRRRMHCNGSPTGACGLVSGME
jgi:hypothetical protein